MPNCTMLITPAGAELYPLYSGTAAEDMQKNLAACIKKLLPAADISAYSAHTLLVQTQLSANEAADFINKLQKCTATLTMKGRLPIYLRAPKLVITSRFSPPTPEAQLLPLLALDHTEALQPQLSPAATNNELLELLCIRRPEVAFAALSAIALTDILGRTAGLPLTTLQNLKTAALWQDSGMLFIPRALLFAACPLSLTQKEQLNSHAKLSAGLAAQHGQNKEVQQLILQHHNPESDPAAALLQIINRWTDLQTEWPWRPAVSASAAQRLISQLSHPATELLNRHQDQLPTPDMIWLAATQNQ